MTLLAVPTDAPVRTAAVNGVASMLAPYDRASAGSLLITGARGMGRTKLLNAAVRLSNADSVRLLGLRPQGRTAYASLRQALHPVVHHRGLVGLGPEMLRILADTPAPPHALARRILTTLRGRPGGEPIVLTVDDVHLCDRGSQELLGYLALHGAAFGLRCILTADETADLAAFGSLDRLLLPPLNATETRVLLEHTTGLPLPYRVASIIHAVSGGNPLLAVDLAAQLTAAELHGTTPVALPRVPSPAVMERLGAQVRNLSVTGRAVMAVFAPCSALPLSLLAATANCSEPVVDHLVQTGWLNVHHGIASPRRRGESLIAWAMTPASDQRALSTRLSDALRQRKPATADYHGAQGGDPEAARRLVSRATQMYAAQDGCLAAATANLARHVAAPLSLDDRVTLALLMVADGFLTAAQELVRQIQTASTKPSSEVMRLLADLAAFTGNPADALPEIDFQNPPDDNLDVWLQAVMSVCRVQLALDGPEDARRLVLAAQPVVARASAETAALYAVVMAEVDLYTDGSSASVRLHSAIQHWLTQRSPGVDVAMVTAALDLLTLGQVNEARDLLLSSGSPRQLLYASARAAFLTVRVETEIATGRFGRAAASLVELDRELPCSTSGDLMVASQAIRVNAACGDLEDCLAIEARMARSTGPVLSYPERGASAAAQGYRELVLGNHRTSRDLLSLALNGPAMLLQGRSDALADLVEATVADGDRAGAAILLEQHARALPDRDGERAAGLVARCQALVADGSKTDELFQVALRLHPPTHDVDHARTLVAYGRVLRQLGRSDDASQPLREAVVAFHQGGLFGWERHAAGLLNGATHQRPRVHRQRWRDGLTPMETDVVNQVLQRRRNRDIARDLFVSLRTVEAHLTRIFRKLDVATKAQLIRLVTADETAVSEPAEFPALSSAFPQETAQPVRGGQQPGHHGRSA